jgi:hypothetical protein
MDTTLQPSPTVLLQRADYTHRHNRENGRHGWLRLTPAYSVKVVEELLAGVDPRFVVLDPFCGTATTALVASYLGLSAITTEINPFLVWYSKTKLDTYDDLDQHQVHSLIDRAVSRAYQGDNCSSFIPNLHNVGRWWNPKELNFLACLKASFNDFGEQIERRKAENIIQVIFCRTLIQLSNAAFNHQSMSFKAVSAIGLPFSDKIDFFANVFLGEAEKVLRGIGDNPLSKAEVIKGDARSVGLLVDRQVDLVITSPPYPNRMSYIRELRPYMYWLDFLSNARDAADLDWDAIGGTWGTATSRLKNWTATSEEYDSIYLPRIVQEIASEQNSNGPLLANYVAKYFCDTFAHFKSLVTLLRPGARLHYVVGNSTFYGTLLPVENLYAEIMHMVGLDCIDIKAIRKRNSKKELIEFCVTARMPLRAAR